MTKIIYVLSQPLCPACGSIMVMGGAPPDLIASCWQQHCADRKKRYKLVMPTIDAELIEDTPA